ncbi:hypothetical protein P1P75_14405 [Streptomyces sp. ID05-39B]|uniref:hypothetical protein n=1 Tax=Streptomyces sp. ID05-39B TaxID=3028664 RepID=UPI0029AA67AE|nr:hypothetical protein [Streptomyces sp. ID05-39B]MDX3527604.1 hypothetical protein [Streptomyces sp. ID05-39B]
MSETTTQTNGVTSQYAAQVASDLERNLKEYDRVAAEVAVLQEQLASLEKDRAVLLNVQQALGVESATASAVEHTTAVPAPRKKASAGASRQSKGKKPEAAAPKAADKQTASRRTSPKPAPKTAPKTAPKAAPKADQPSLVTLVREHLAGQSEPRSAAEVAQSLGQQHPERGIKTTVVRTTLEGLVAKNRAQRSKQGSSVFYTSPDASASATSREGAKEEVEEGAPQETRSA